MRPRISAVVFATVYCCAYIGLLATNAPLFLYYPRTNQIAWGWNALAEGGPAITWYGLMASAAAIAVLCAVAIQEQWFVTRLRNYLWLFPLGAMLACVYLMKQFFV